MRDQEITELFWERKEQAVIESNIRYGTYCRRISYNILANEEDVEECMNDTWYQAWNAIPPQRPLCLKAFFENYSQSFSQPLEVGSGRKTDSTRSNVSIG